jgi:hypothetical protein
MTSMAIMPSPRSGRTSRRDAGFLLAAELFLIVLIAEAIVIAHAALSMAEVGSLYITVT